MNKNERFAMKKVVEDLESIRNELSTIGKAKADCLARLPKQMRESKQGMDMEGERIHLAAAIEMEEVLINYIKDNLLC